VIVFLIGVEEEYFMSTGIIRRIDDLGRVVIPKEIRRMYRIYEGDPLEIIASENCISIVPYREKNLKSVSLPLLETFCLQYSVPVAVCNRYEYILWREVYINQDKKIPGSLETLLVEGTERLSIERDDQSSEINHVGAVFPIVVDGNKVGGVVLFYGKSSFTAEEIACARFMARTAANLLSLE